MDIKILFRVCNLPMYLFNLRKQTTVKQMQMTIRMVFLVKFRPIMSLIFQPPTNGKTGNWKPGSLISQTIVISPEEQPVIQDQE